MDLDLGFNGVAQLLFPDCCPLAGALACTLARTNSLVVLFSILSITVFRCQAEWGHCLSVELKAGRRVKKRMRLVSWLGARSERAEVGPDGDSFR